MSVDLQKVLEQSIKSRNRLTADTHRNNMCHNKQVEFDKLVGEPMLWRTSKNLNLKQAQLVTIKQAYQNFVLVEKSVMNVEGKSSVIRYGISYDALYCGHDKLQELGWV